MRRKLDNKTPEEIDEDERHWEVLLGRIKEGICTPFIGAGACFGSLPLGAQIARAWANAYGYPMEDAHDLARVAQFVAVQYTDAMFPKERILRFFNAIEQYWRLGRHEATPEKLAQLFDHLAPTRITADAKRAMLSDMTAICEQLKAPLFHDPLSPHGLLADLQLPIYITTNYDDFMVAALKSRGKEPKRELCRWNKFVKRQPSVFDRDSGYTPSSANPVVFHLHGHHKVKESLVLTEDDYLDFLVNWSPDDEHLLPAAIQGAMASTSLLFIGYALADWDFRILFRSIVTYLERSTQRKHVSVQIAPSENRTPEQRKTNAHRYAEAQKYLDRYFGRHDIQVYWGTSQDFVSEFRSRWDALNGQVAPFALAPNLTGDLEPSSSN